MEKDLVEEMKGKELTLDSLFNFITKRSAGPRPLGSEGVTLVSLLQDFLDEEAEKGEEQEADELAGSDEVPVVEVTEDQIPSLEEQDAAGETLEKKLSDFERALVDGKKSDMNIRLSEDSRFK